MEVEAIRRMSYCEVGEMLESAAWRKVSEMLSKDMEEKPKLCLLKEIADLRVEEVYTSILFQLLVKAMLKAPVVRRLIL